MNCTIWAIFGLFVVYLFAGWDAVVLTINYTATLSLVLFLILWMMQDWILKMRIKLWRYLEEND